MARPACSSMASVTRERLASIRCSPRSRNDPHFLELIKLTEFRNPTVLMNNLPAGDLAQGQATQRGMVARLREPSQSWRASTQLSDHPPARLADPCVVVIFGATGDLTKRKLIPA